MATLSEHVSNFIKRLYYTQNITQYCVAYSGGVDSHALLAIFSKIATQHSYLKVRAVHINHGISGDADRWSVHCANVCNQLAIGFENISIQVPFRLGDSPEASAREARYEAFRTILNPQECLTTAQHQDDQAETLLLQLLRGSGPKGLASMPEIAPFAKGYIARPLLRSTRKQVFEYARENHLSWVEDFSNQDRSFDRNYLRHEVIPVLKKRWPALSKTLSRSAQLCAQAQKIVDKDTQTAMRIVLLDKQLSVTELKKFEQAQQRNIIRYWIKQLGLPGPTQAGMQQIIDSVLNASVSAKPLVKWAGCEIRRYQDRLYAMPPLKTHSPALQISWDLNSCTQSSIFGELCVRPVIGSGIDKSLLQTEHIKIAFRKGGEVYCEHKNVGTRSLKKYFQECAIPPWLRDRVPLIYVGQQLVAIADYAVCCDFKASPQEKGVQVVWNRLSQ